MCGCDLCRFQDTVSGFCEQVLRLWGTVDQKKIQCMIAKRHPSPDKRDSQKQFEKPKKKHNDSNDATVHEQLERIRMYKVDCHYENKRRKVRTDRRATLHDILTMFHKLVNMQKSPDASSLLAVAIDQCILYDNPGSVYIKEELIRIVYTALAKYSKQNDNKITGNPLISTLTASIWDVRDALYGLSQSTDWSETPVTFIDQFIRDAMKQLEIRLSEITDGTTRTRLCSMQQSIRQLDRSPKQVCHFSCVRPMVCITIEAPGKSTYAHYMVDLVILLKRCQSNFEDTESSVEMQNIEDTIAAMSDQSSGEHTESGVEMQNIEDTIAAMSDQSSGEHTESGALWQEKEKKNRVTQHTLNDLTADAHYFYMLTEEDDKPEPKRQKL